MAIRDCPIYSNAESMPGGSASDLLRAQQNPGALLFAQQSLLKHAHGALCGLAL